MDGLGRKLVMGFTAVSIAAATIGVYSALHSSLFLVQVVEVNDQSDDAPVDSQTISRLAAVPAGMVNLFDLDLRAVEQRILSNHWIREVRLQKRFPQTLAIAVTYREPKALMQNPDGTLSYVDVDGKAFGQVNLKFRSDLPLLSGFHAQSQKQTVDALKIVSALETSVSTAGAILSSLEWDRERGYRALISYPMEAKPQAVAGRGAVKTIAAAPIRSWGRAAIDLGQEIDSRATGIQLSRLSEVLKYLGANSIPVQQIWADAEKKIVVKTIHGS